MGCAVVAGLVARARLPTVMSEMGLLLPPENRMGVVAEELLLVRHDVSQSRPREILAAARLASACLAERLMVYSPFID